MVRSNSAAFIDCLEIGTNCRPKIIAEIGINHNGSLDYAKRLADLAMESGADIVKTQLHLPSDEMSDAAKFITPKHCDSSIYEIIESCALSLDDEYELKSHIEKSGKIYMSTPFSLAAADILGRQFNVKAFKIGSGECNNFPILDAISTFDKPVVISTGMNSLASCVETYNYVSHRLSAPIFLMHTTNLYPTPPHLVRLGGIAELQDIAGISYVGLSDHTTSNLACLGAVAMGAVILERHFTDTKDRPGPDVINSMDPTELRCLRRDSEILFEMRGGSKIHQIPEEQGTRDFAFATVVAKKDIRQGQRLSSDNITVKRPGIGDYPAKSYSRLLGMTAATDIRSGEHICAYHILE